MKEEDNKYIIPDRENKGTCHKTMYLSTHKLRKGLERLEKQML
jgi:hypothetical protein